MTIETWMTEAGLPITQKPESELEAARMSLRKWEALRSKVLQRHGMNLAYGTVTDEDLAGKYVTDGISCALCHFHAPQGSSYPECAKCIITRTQGRECSGSQAYCSAIYRNNIRPMLNLLRKAVKTLESGQ